MARRGSEYYKLIRSTRWQQLRAEVLRNEPLCRRCMDNGRYTPATELHHITPASTAGTRADIEALMFNPANLMPLCHQCHVAIHRQMKSRSKATRIKNQAAKLEDFKRKFNLI